MSAKLTITGTVAVMKDLETVGNTKRLNLVIPENVYRPQTQDSVTIWHKITLWGRHTKQANIMLAKGSVIEATCSVSYNKC